MTKTVTLKWSHSPVHIPNLSIPKPVPVHVSVPGRFGTVKDAKTRVFSAVKKSALRAKERLPKKKTMHKVATHVAIAAAQIAIYSCISHCLLTPILPIGGNEHTLAAYASSTPAFDTPSNTPVIPVQVDSYRTATSFEPNTAGFEEGFARFMGFLRAVAKPVTMIFMTIGFYYILTGKQSEGLQKIKYAIWGFLGICFVPWIMQILEAMFV